MYWHIGYILALNAHLVALSAGKGGGVALIWFWFTICHLLINRSLSQLEMWHHIIIKSVQTRALSQAGGVSLLQN